MWITELAMNTSTADSRIGSQSPESPTTQASFVRCSSLSVTHLALVNADHFPGSFLSLLAKPPPKWMIAPITACALVLKSERVGEIPVMYLQGRAGGGVALVHFSMCTA